MTPTDLCNQALALVGQSFITSLDETEDESHNANVCRAFYETERDATLRDHAWNFAIRRKVLATTAAPVSGYIFAFERDPDDLRVLAINDDPNAVYQLEGRTIITNETTLTVKYVARIIDPTQWDPLCISAFTLRMASKLALAIAHDAVLSAKLFDQYLLLIGGAETVDGQEGTPVPYTSPDLIEVRRS